MSLILCRHEPVKHPYYIDVLGIHIHSSQELCYVIYNHPILVMDDFIDELLIEFIRRNLDMDYLAGRMEKLLETGSRHEDVLFLFLSECDYYNDKEYRNIRQPWQPCAPFIPLNMKRRGRTICSGHASMAKRHRDTARCLNIRPINRSMTLSLQRYTIIWARPTP